LLERKNEAERDREKDIKTEAKKKTCRREKKKKKN